MKIDVTLMGIIQENERSGDCTRNNEEKKIKLWQKVNKAEEEAKKMKIEVK